MSSPIDPVLLDEIYEGDSTLFCEVMDILSVELPGRLYQIRVLLDHSRFSELRPLVHSLKSSCLTVAARSAAEAAAAMEELDQQESDLYLSYYRNLMFEINSLLDYYKGSEWRELFVNYGKSESSKE